MGTGGHIISVNDVYGGTNRYFSKVASTQGISTTFVNLLDPHNIESAFRPNTKVYIFAKKHTHIYMLYIQKINYNYV